MLNSGHLTVDRGAMSGYQETGARSAPLPAPTSGCRIPVAESGKRRGALLTVNVPVSPILKNKGNLGYFLILPPLGSSTLGSH